MKASLSAIKESPVPIRFELRPISELFQVIMMMMMMMMMMTCQATGGYPPPELTWWIGTRRLAPEQTVSSTS